MDGQESRQRPGSYLERDHNDRWVLVGLEEWEELPPLSPIAILPDTQGPRGPVAGGREEGDEMPQR